MEVKPGYRQTDIGSLPIDWETGLVGEAIVKLEAGASVNSDRDDTPDYESYPRVLKTGAAKAGSLDPRESKRVARRDLWRLKIALRRDTILISRMNTLELVGESGYVQDDYPNLFVPDRMWMATVRSTVYPRWFSYVLTWQPVKSRISSSATGTSGSMKNISKHSLRAVEISYPPITEQRAIAGALSDVDALLEGLSRLIAKKRDLKQAAMQQLLTGQTRLPGFRDEWEVKRLGDIATCFSGGTPPTRVTAYYDGNIPWITSGDLNQEYITDVEGRISEAGLANSAAQMVEANTLLIALYGATSGVAAISKIRAAINQAVLAVIPRTDDTLFLYFILRFRKKWLISTYTQGGQPNLSGDLVKSMELFLPSVPEQTAIAAVLSDADAELTALDARRDKIRALKQAMMQELLTGRVRLV